MIDFMPLPRTLTRWHAVVVFHGCGLLTWSFWKERCIFSRPLRARGVMASWPRPRPQPFYTWIFSSLRIWIFHSVRSFRAPGIFSAALLYLDLSLWLFSTWIFLGGPSLHLDFLISATLLRIWILILAELPRTRIFLYRSSPLGFFNVCGPSLHLDFLISATLLRI